MKKAIYILLAAVLAAGCAEDKGNYDYSENNGITIGGVENNYIVERFDRLQIEPDLEFAVRENSNLAYEWYVNGKLVSTDPVCDAVIDETPNGVVANDPHPNYYFAYLRVTDKDSGLQYYRHFQVKVGTSYTTALFLLGEKADGAATLTAQRRDRAGAPLQYDVFEANNPEFGAFGRKPLMLLYRTGTYGTKSFYAVCREGERKIMAFNATSMLMTNYYNAASVGGSYTGDVIPSAFTERGQTGGMVLSEGKAFLFNFWNSGTFYYPAGYPDHHNDYHFSWVDTDPSILSYGFAGYDETSQKFKTLKPLETNQAAFSRIENMAGDGSSTAGQTFVAAGMKAGSSESTAYIILRNGGTAYFYAIDIWFEMDWINYIFDMGASYRLVDTHAGLIKDNMVCQYCNDLNWYLADGNKITRLGVASGSTPQAWFTAPKGNVTAMMSDPALNRLLVATWDGTKGYIYTISMTSANTTTDNNVIELDHKIVSMAATGTWKF